MKNILSLWLCQTMSIIFITRCQAYDPSELYDLVGNNYEERNSNSRGFGEPYNLNRANQIYEAVDAGRARRPKQQNYISRAAGETKFTRPRNLRKPLHPDVEHHFRSAYDTAHRTSNIRNGDRGVTNDFITDSGNHSEEDSSNRSVINEDSYIDNRYTNGFGVSTGISTSTNYANPSAASCTCEGPEANDEISFLCFSSNDGSNTFSMKYKGTTKFKLEDIIKAYSMYFNNIQFDSFYFENVLKADKIFKHQFDKNNKFNINTNNEGHININTNNEGHLNINTNTDNKFDMNEIQQDAKIFKVKDFNKFDVNMFKKDSKTFDLNIINNIMKNNSNFNYEDNLESLKKINNFDANIFKKDSKTFDLNIINNIMKNNSNFNVEDMNQETLKKIQDSIKVIKNNNIHINTNVQADGQFDIEAYLKALQAQQDKIQTMIQNQIAAQALESQIKFQAQVNGHQQGHVNGNVQAHSQGQINSQSQTYSFGEKKKFDANYGKQTSESIIVSGGGGGAFDLNGGSSGSFSISGGGGGGFGIEGGASGGFGIEGGASGGFGIEGGASGGFGIGGGTSGVFGIGGGASGGIGIGGGANGAMGIGGAAGGGFGIGGGASGGMGIGGAAGGGFGIGGGASGGMGIGGAAGGGFSFGGAASGGFGVGRGAGGGFGIGGGAGGSFGFGGGANGGIRLFGREALPRNELNDEDSFYDEKSDDAFKSGYKGLTAIPATNKSLKPVSRFASNDRNYVEASLTP